MSPASQRLQMLVAAVVSSPFEDSMPATELGYTLAIGEYALSLDRDVLSNASMSGYSSRNLQQPGGLDHDVEGQDDAMDADSRSVSSYAVQNLPSHPSSHYSVSEFCSPFWLCALSNFFTTKLMSIDDYSMDVFEYPDLRRSSWEVRVARIKRSAGHLIVLMLH